MFMMESIALLAGNGSEGRYAGPSPEVAPAIHSLRGHPLCAGLLKSGASSSSPSADGDTVVAEAVSANPIRLPKQTDLLVGPAEGVCTAGSSLDSVLPPSSCSTSCSASPDASPSAASSSSGAALSASFAAVPGVQVFKTHGQTTQSSDSAATSVAVESSPFSPPHETCSQQAWRGVSEGAQDNIPSPSPLVASTLLRGFLGLQGQRRWTTGGSPCASYGAVPQAVAPPGSSVADTVALVKQTGAQAAPALGQEAETLVGIPWGALGASALSFLLVNGASQRLGIEAGRGNGHLLQEAAATSVLLPDAPSHPKKVAGVAAPTAPSQARSSARPAGEGPGSQRRSLGVGSRLLVPQRRGVAPSTEEGRGSLPKSASATIGNNKASYHPDKQEWRTRYYQDGRRCMRTYSAKYYGYEKAKCLAETFIRYVQTHGTVPSQQTLMFEAEQARLAGQTVAGQGSFSSDAADSVTPLSPASEAAAFNSCAAAPASQHSSNGGISASRSSFCSPVSFHLEPTTANAFSSVASPSAAPVEGQNSPVLHANAPSFGGDSSKKTGCHQSTLSSVRLALPDDAVDGEENVTAHRRPFSKRRLQGSPTSSLSSGLPPVLGHVEGRAELLDGDSGAASCCAAVPGCSTAGAADRAVDAPNGVSGKAGGADCPRHFTSLLPAANCGAGLTFSPGQISPAVLSDSLRFLEESKRLCSAPPHQLSGDAASEAADGSGLPRDLQRNLFGRKAIAAASSYATRSRSEGSLNDSALGRTSAIGVGQGRSVSGSSLQQSGSSDVGVSQQGRARLVEKAFSLSEPVEEGSGPVVAMDRVAQPCGNQDWEMAEVGESGQQAPAISGTADQGLGEDSTVSLLQSFFKGCVADSLQEAGQQATWDPGLPSVFECSTREEGGVDDLSPCGTRVDLQISSCGDERKPRHGMRQLRASPDPLFGMLSLSASSCHSAWPAATSASGREGTLCPPLRGARDLHVSESSLTAVKRHQLGLNTGHEKSHGSVSCQEGTSSVSKGGAESNLRLDSRTSVHTSAGAPGLEPSGGLHCLQDLECQPHQPCPKGAEESDAPQYASKVHKRKRSGHEKRQAPAGCCFDSPSFAATPAACSSVNGHLSGHGHAMMNDACLPPWSCACGSTEHPQPGTFDRLESIFHASRGRPQFQGDRMVVDMRREATPAGSLATECGLQASQAEDFLPTLFFMLDQGGERHAHAKTERLLQDGQQYLELYDSSLRSISTLPSAVFQALADLQVLQGVGPASSRETCRGREEERWQLRSSVSEDDLREGDGGCPDSGAEAEVALAAGHIRTGSSDAKDTWLGRRGEQLGAGRENRAAGHGFVGLADQLMHAHLTSLSRLANATGPPLFCAFASVYDQQGVGWTEFEPLETSVHEVRRRQGNLDRELKQGSWILRARDAVAALAAHVLRAAVDASSAPRFVADPAPACVAGAGEAAQQADDSEALEEQSTASERSTTVPRKSVVVPKTACRSTEQGASPVGERSVLLGSEQPSEVAGAVEEGQELHLFGSRHDTNRLKERSSLEHAAAEGKRNGESEADKATPWNRVAAVDKGSVSDGRFQTGKDRRVLSVLPQTDSEAAVLNENGGATHQEKTQVVSSAGITCVTVPELVGSGPAFQEEEQMPSLERTSFFVVKDEKRADAASEEDSGKLARDSTVERDSGSKDVNEPSRGSALRAPGTGTRGGAAAEGQGVFEAAGLVSEERRGGSLPCCFPRAKERAARQLFEQYCILAQLGDRLGAELEKEKEDEQRRRQRQQAAVKMGAITALAQQLFRDNIRLLAAAVDALRQASSASDGRGRGEENAEPRNAGCGLKVPFAHPTSRVVKNDEGGTREPPTTARADDEPAVGSACPAADGLLIEQAEQTRMSGNTENSVSEPTDPRPSVVALPAPADADAQAQTDSDYPVLQKLIPEAPVSPSLVTCCPHTTAASSVLSSLSGDSPTTSLSPQTSCAVFEDAPCAPQLSAVLGEPSTFQQVEQPEGGQDDGTLGQLPKREGRHCLRSSETRTRQGPKEESPSSLSAAQACMEIRQVVQRLRPRMEQIEVFSKRCISLFSLQRQVLAHQRLQLSAYEEQRGVKQRGRTSLLASDFARSAARALEGLSNSSIPDSAGAEEAVRRGACPTAQRRSRLDSGLAASIAESPSGSLQDLSGTRHCRARAQVTGRLRGEDSPVSDVKNRRCHHGEGTGVLKAAWEERKPSRAQLRDDTEFFSTGKMLYLSQPDSREAGLRQTESSFTKELSVRRKDPYAYCLFRDPGQRDGRRSCLAARGVDCCGVGGPQNIIGCEVSGARPLSCSTAETSSAGGQLAMEQQGVGVAAAGSSGPVVDDVVLNAACWLSQLTQCKGREDFHRGDVCRGNPPGESARARRRESETELGLVPGLTVQDNLARRDDISKRRRLFAGTREETNWRVREETEAFLLSLQTANVPSMPEISSFLHMKGNSMSS